ncbi:MAG TPA: trypsin-like peptidase domain-containing protein [Candidatus Dormibacteraeota bacterium]|nr:trypsin-like peptidase domain-containing protein [Candidatus Dormibacteraeota bacterium]
MSRATLRLAAVTLAALAVMACTIRNTPTPTASPSGQPTVSEATPTPSAAPPAAAGAFDPAHVAAVLGPAVAEVIVNTGAGSVDEGTAFAISHSGSATYMITNNHVIAGGQEIQVLFLDGRHFTATLKGTDSVGDIAVLSVPDNTLPLATLADSSKVVLGEQVVAIGSPLGTAGAVTAGIVSSLHRTITAGGSISTPSETLKDVMQTDAAINPGNSGGPLADGDGQVIGVTTAADTTGTNVGFAIPSLLAKRLADDLIAGKQPTHPFLGVSFREESDALAAGVDVAGYGTLVDSVVAGSAAAKAGVQKGDIIQKVDGVELNNGQTLAGQLELHEVGDTVTLTILRGSSDQNLKVTLGARPAGV